MSIDTTVTQSRNGTQIGQGIPVQIDEVNPMLAATYNNAHPYDVFAVYVTYAPSALVFLRGDLLKDEKNSDPLTGQNTLYRVAGRPESFPDNHWEIVAEVFAGKA